MTEWMDVAAEIQEELVRSYLLKVKTNVTPKDVKSGLKQFRIAASKNPDICHYVKYNRVRACQYGIGQQVPDVNMIQTCNGSNIGLLYRNLSDKNKPLVLIAGSIS